MLFVDWGCDPIFKMFFLWVSDDFPPPTLEGISFRMDRSGTPFKVPVHLRLARQRQPPPSLYFYTIEGGREDVSRISTLRSHM